VQRRKEVGFGVMTNLGNKLSCSSRLEGGIGEEEREYHTWERNGVMGHMKHPFSM
jgi:hypothetical protein